MLALGHVVVALEFSLAIRTPNLTQTMVEVMMPFGTMRTDIKVISTCPKSNSKCKVRSPLSKKKPKLIMKNHQVIIRTCF
ncbi:hypothetical protein Hanom_Chr11g01026301 [Helianthus anomalus]